jgi:hypothetical protein
MTGRGLSVEQLRATNPVCSLLPLVLADEQRLGRVERAADGTWKASDAFVAEFGQALSALSPLTRRTYRRERPT